MAVSDLLCLLCHRPAHVVLSTRIDRGQVHYPACETHVHQLAGRLAADALRAITNLDAAHPRHDPTVIDTTVVEGGVPTTRLISEGTEA